MATFATSTSRFTARTSLQKVFMPHLQTNKSYSEAARYHFLIKIDSRIEFMKLNPFPDLHMEVHTRGDTKCDVCHISFTKRALSAHMSLVHLDLRKERHEPTRTEKVSNTNL